MKRVSIRTKITLMVIAAIFVMVIIMLAIFELSGVTVLENTTRDYLISAVESNINKIEYVGGNRNSPSSSDDVLMIEYKDGHLAVDIDFLDSMNDVDSALYTGDGRLLYGSNPYSVEMDGEALNVPRIYKRTFDGITCYVYERKLTGEGLDGLWIRGIVPLRQAREQIGDIMKLLMYFLPLILIVTVIGGALIAYRILKPLRKMQKDISGISDETDLSGRIDVKEGRDEITALAGSYNEMLDRIESAFEREKRFTSDVSHELRTPMSVILAQTEYALEKDGDKEEYRDALEVIKRQGDRMAALIDDMLTYSRIDSGSDRYPKEELDLSELVESVTDEMSLLSQKGIVIRTDICDGITMEGNRDLLIRMFQNLIENAYKYGRENGHILVALKKADEEQKIEVIVEDDGIGISEEDQKKIFDRFYRADSARSRESGSVKGSGLGLPIVKMIVSYHKGTIRVVSSEGKGSRFEIFF